MSSSNLPQFFFEGRQQPSHFSLKRTNFTKRKIKKKSENLQMLHKHLQRKKNKNENKNRKENGSGTGRCTDHRQRGETVRR
jgi:hypothetical protein